MNALILSLVLVGTASIARAQLTPAEQAFSKGLDSAAQAKYEATREYYHRAAAIIAKTADPLSLGSKPQAFDAQYLKTDEASTISQARDLSNIALMNGIKFTAPPPSGLPPAQGVLTPDEQAFSKGLDSAAQTKYKATREYVHKAAAIVKKTADPISLGRKPKDYDAAYLQGDEASIVSQARDLSNIALIQGLNIGK